MQWYMAWQTAVALTLVSFCRGKHMSGQLEQNKEKHPYRKNYCFH